GEEWDRIAAFVGLTVAVTAVGCGHEGRIIGRVSLRRHPLDAETSDPDRRDHYCADGGVKEAGGGECNHSLSALIFTYLRLPARIARIRPGLLFTAAGDSASNSLISSAPGAVVPLRKASVSPAALRARSWPLPPSLLRLGAPRTSLGGYAPLGRRSRNRHLTRNRSGSLQRRVCELSVPERRTSWPENNGVYATE